VPAGRSMTGAVVLAGFASGLTGSCSTAGLAVLVALGPALGVITGAEVPVGKTIGSVVSVAGGLEGAAVTADDGAVVPVG